MKLLRLDLKENFYENLITGGAGSIGSHLADKLHNEAHDYMRRRVPSLEKAKRLVGYEPTRTLEEIINDVAREFRDELKSEIASA